MKVFSLAVFCAVVAVSSVSVLMLGELAPLNYSQLDTPEGITFCKDYSFQFIFPGTKWCGNGHIAENEDDLGYFTSLDACCRAHDHCYSSIRSGETEHGLYNDGFRTRYHCTCDLEFLNCLTSLNSPVCGIVGNGYFDNLDGICFDLRPPATCVGHDNITGSWARCVLYEYDETKPAEWQWFDLPRCLFDLDSLL